MGPLRANLLRAVREAALVAAGSALLGLGFNAVRPAGIPLVATQPYAIHVPCPDTTGKFDAMQPGDPRLAQPATLVIDARPAKEFAAWHVEGALSIPFDFLDPVPEPSVQGVLRSKATAVVVYGDGDEPDTGRELAKELAGKGIRNVFYLEGGAPALRGGKP